MCMRSRLNPVGEREVEFIFNTTETNRAVLISRGEVITKKIKTVFKELSHRDAEQVFMS